MPSITQLQYLLAVQKHKHFSRAAKECHVSQPSLSSQIQKCEMELETIIFDRSKSPILETQKGSLILKQAKIVLDEYKQLNNIAQSDIEISGEFKLAVIPTLASYVIPLFVKEFSKKYPKVDLIINEYKTEDITRMLKDDLLDGAILVTPLRDDLIIERVLFYESFFLYVSPSHSLYKHKRLADKDINNVDIWLLSEGHCFRNQAMKLCSRGVEYSPLKNVNFESGSFNTLINLVDQTGGMTILPELAISDVTHAENVRSFKDHSPKREVSLVYSRSFYKEHIINALEKEVIGSLPSHISSSKKESFEIIDI
jgi:LysR family transcriptional regulator, hydrogen peroxide-inducible genes activator